MNYVHSQRSFARLLRPLAFAALLGAGAAARGAVVVSLTDNIGDPQSISLHTGDAFTLTLRVSSTTERLAMLSLYLLAPGAGSGKFTLVSRDNIGSLFSNYNLTPFEPVTLVSANNPKKDLGAELPDFGTDVAAGTYFLTNYTFATSGLAPGQYSITVNSESIGLDANFNAFAITGDSPYLVNVTTAPEPGVALLTMGGISMLALRRRRTPQIPCSRGL